MGMSDNVFVRELVVINYSMDENDPLLAHQIEAVRSLSQSFSKVTVITSRRGEGKVPLNVDVIDLKWGQRTTIGNLYNFLRLVIPLISRRNVVVFSHMTDVQAAIIAPFARLLGVPHFQWYAHKTLSKYLKWSSLWVNGIITSTPGSCPISGNKVTSIGQALIPKSFDFILRDKNELSRALHIGRFDPSKNIDLIGETCAKILAEGLPLTFTQIGNSSTLKSKTYASGFQDKYEVFINKKVFILMPSIPRYEIVNYMRLNDFFIHAYEGSLDKTLIEATLSGLPVITLNPEYRAEFGTWSQKRSPSLYDEFQAVKNLQISDLQRELLRRRKECENNHSLENWTRKLVAILINE
jgi:glycosyltransferase involved in cell wall biosynthesis